MNINFDDERVGTKIYNKVVSRIMKTKNIEEAYDLVPSIQEEIGAHFKSAILGAIDFYYDEYVQQAWNGRPLEDYMRTFL